MGEAGLFVGETRRTSSSTGRSSRWPSWVPARGLRQRLNRLLGLAVGDRAVVQVQNPVGLDERSEPQPDVALLHPPLDRYLAGHPGPV